jgi:hypothetical protein
MWDPPTIVIELRGGLGNQLFQLAAGEYLSLSLNRTLILETNPSPHSSVSYLDTFLKKWRHFRRPHRHATTVEETTLAFQDWSCLNEYDHVKALGYFQDWRYVNKAFVRYVNESFSNQVLSKYPDINKSVFIHVRGGDYKGHEMHGVDLTQYYANAMALFPEDTVYSIFTNDVEYAKKLNLPGSVIEENEVDSLFLMTQCKGGICANSTYSWWGAYLNPRRRLVLPDTWFAMSGFNTEGLYFPGSIKCPVSRRPALEVPPEESLPRGASPLHPMLLADPADV